MMDRLIVGVLQEARELCRTDWGTKNEDVSWEDASGVMCASIAIVTAETTDPICELAHRAFCAGAGIGLRGGQDPYAAVYAFNDAQTDRKPVLAAFDRAIATLEGEATPNADVALAVMDACDRAGEIVAEYIMSEHPEMDPTEIKTLAASELFYAAQDTARVCDLASS